MSISEVCQVFNVVQINLGKLKNGEGLVLLIKEKLKVSSVLEGKKIIVKDEDKTVRMKDIKTILKKFLHHEGLRKNTRILIENGEVNLIEMK